MRGKRALRRLTAMKGTDNKRIHPPNRRPGATGRSLLLLALLFACAAHAQRAVVISASLSATRQSARLYTQAVDLESGTVLPGGAALPGSSLLGTPVTGVFAEKDHLPEGFIAVATGPSDPALHPDSGYPETGISLVRPLPFMVMVKRFHESEAGWREWAADVLSDPSPPGLLILGSRAGGTDTAPMVGRARLFGGGADAAGTLTAEWSLPGAPVAGLWISGARSAVVLCAGQGGAAPVLVKCDLGAQQTLRRAADELAGWNAACTDARALVRLPETDLSVVAFSGRIPGTGSTEPASQVYVVDSTKLTVMAGPVNLRGMVDRIHVVDDKNLWIASRAPGTDFAYVTKLHVDPATATATLEAEYPLTGAMDGFLTARDPATGSVAVALGTRLEIWPEGKRGELRQEYENPIRDLCWTADGLLVGEAGRVHLADAATGVSKRVIQLQTGHVVAIVPVTVGPQGTDKPVSAGPANRIIAPSVMLFRGEAAGRELRALNIESDGVPGPWRVAYDAAQMPWLVIHPLSGHGSGTVYMGVDPARRLPHTLAEGWLSVSLEGGSPPVPAQDSPAKVLLRVEPAPASARTILWLWPDAATQMRDPSNPRGMAGLASQLAAAPQYFSHAESSDPVTSPLDPYAVIVLHAGAAVRGVLSRQALVDYVADGGGLLVVGGADKGQAETLGPWVAPFGAVTLSDPAPVANASPAHAGPEPIRSWPGMPMSAAYGFRAAIGGARDAFAPKALKVLRVPEGPAEAPALFLARSFGYGRVALLASEAPLRAASSGGLPETFARELFVWLAGAGISAQDMDRDGLTDDLEDLNGNGARDPGETDWIRADTDGDGISDGLEDWNRNGMVDPGETDPRNPDTDGDGFWDSADPSPAPVFDAPRIAGVMPYAGPAEGGGIVLVRGEGLLPGAEYRFGGQPAECLAPGDGSCALVRVPELAGNSGGAVSVSAILPGRGLRADLPGGYQYQSRSRAAVTLVSLEPAASGGGNAHGRLGVVLSVSPPCAFANAVVLVTPPAIPGFSWQALPSKKATLHIFTNDEAGISITGDAQPNSTAGVTLAEITWTCPNPVGGVIEFPVPGALVRTVEGGRMLEQPAGISIPIPRPAPPG